MPNAVSLFSGCGGFCEGIELSGITVKAAVEHDKFAAQTYRRNFPDVPLFEGDVAEFMEPGREQEYIEEYDLKDIDIVFGGPPCQGYSQIGTRDINDPRNSLYEQFARIVNDLKPSVFLMENVVNLLLLKEGYYKDLILKRFADIGYSQVVTLQLSAEEFGVPQTRKRVIFLGIKDDAYIGEGLGPFVESALEAQKVENPFTVADAISDLPAAVVESGEILPYPDFSGGLTDYQRLVRMDVNAGSYSNIEKYQKLMEKPDFGLFNHHTKQILERRRELISYLEPGKKGDSLPPSVWDGKRPEKWRRLHPDLPAYTILAQMHRDLSEWVHPWLDRWITVREAARLQSFHDGFVFETSEWQQLKQIGNAVPPLLGKAVGEVAREVLGNLETGEVVAVPVTDGQQDLFSTSAVV